jgi:hypothetical protein
MPGSRLNIGFYGDEKTPEQIFIIPFREGGTMLNILSLGA